jgi:hypothetical protein
MQCTFCPDECRCETRPNRWAFWLALALLIFASALRAESITITAAPGATIYYTNNGTTPTIKSTRYTGPITISQSCTLKAIQVDAEGNVSPVAEAVYTFEAPAPAIAVSGETAVLSDTSPEVDIFYTTLGNLPTTSSARYTGPIAVTPGMTVRAMAAKTGWTSSAVTSVEVPK